MVRLHDVFAQGLGFVLVFEYMISDLSEMIHNIDLPLMEDQVKSYMEMLLRGKLLLIYFNFYEILLFQFFPKRNGLLARSEHHASRPQTG